MGWCGVLFVIICHLILVRVMFCIRFLAIALQRGLRREFCGMLFESFDEIYVLAVCLDSVNFA
jgi:hypothetical protein